MGKGFEKYTHNDRELFFKVAFDFFKGIADIGREKFERVG